MGSSSSNSDSRFCLVGSESHMDIEVCFLSYFSRTQPNRTHSPNPVPLPLLSFPFYARRGIMQIQPVNPINKRDNDITRLAAYVVVVVLVVIMRFRQKKNGLDNPKKEK